MFYLSDKALMILTIRSDVLPSPNGFPLYFLSFNLDILSTFSYMSLLCKEERNAKPVFKISSVDEDEGLWETVVDFTKLRKGGIPADELLVRLK